MRLLIRLNKTGITKLMRRLTEDGHQCTTDHVTTIGLTLSTQNEMVIRQFVWDVADQIGVNVNSIDTEK